MLVGQTKLYYKLDKTSLDTFPRSLLLIGPKGCGKHSFCNEIGRTFNLLVDDITKELNQETIEEIYQRVEPYLYYIDCNQITVKSQNVILKFIEEPLKNSYVILGADSTNSLLPTVLNRCEKWFFKSYSKELLNTFIPKECPEDKREFILQLAETPGQVKQLFDMNVQGLVGLAQKIVEKLSVASLSNTLTITDKVAFKDEQDKFNCNFFMRALTNVVRDKIASDNNYMYVRMYEVVSNAANMMTLPNLDKKNIFENCLVSCWTIVRGEQ